MDYSEKFINQIITVGKLSYNFDKIINVIEIPDIAAFTADFYNPESIIAKAYKKAWIRLNI